MERENQVLFEYTSKSNLAETRAAYRTLFFKKALFSTLAWYVLVLAMAAFLISQLVRPLLGQGGAAVQLLFTRYWPQLLLYAGFIGLCIAYPFIRVEANARRTIKGKAATAAEYTRRFTEEGVETTTAQGEGLVKWEQFTHCYCTKQYIVLFVGNLMYTIDPSRLTQGSPEELTDFILQKMQGRPGQRRG